MVEHLRTRGSTAFAQRASSPTAADDPRAAAANFVRDYYAASADTRRLSETNCPLDFDL